MISTSLCFADICFVFGSVVLLDITFVLPSNLETDNVDVDWKIFETDEYGSWTDRNPLQATVRR